MFCNAKYGNLNLGVMIAVAVVCAIAGDSVGYEFGKKFGPSLRRSRLGRWVGEHRWAAVDGFIHRHGGKAVLLGRLTALMRALMPSMAGMSGMRYRTFLLWNAAGGIVWAPGCVLLGLRVRVRAGRRRRDADLGPARHPGRRHRGLRPDPPAQAQAGTGRGGGLRRADVETTI